MRHIPYYGILLWNTLSSSSETDCHNRKVVLPPPSSNTFDIGHGKIASCGAAVSAASQTLQMLQESGSAIGRRLLFTGFHAACMADPINQPTSAAY